MQEKAHTISPEIVRLIERTVHEYMVPFGFHTARVRGGEDHDGDPVIFVDVEYDLSDNPIDPAVTGALTTILRDKLWEQGETRFPHIQHKFDEHQQVKPRRRAKT